MKIVNPKNKNHCHFTPPCSVLRTVFISFSNAIVSCFNAPVWGIFIFLRIISFSIPSIDPYGMTWEFKHVSLYVRDRQQQPFTNIAMFVTFFFRNRCVSSFATAHEIGNILRMLFQTYLHPFTTWPETYRSPVWCDRRKHSSPQNLELRSFSFFSQCDGLPPTSVMIPVDAVFVVPILLLIPSSHVDLYWVFFHQHTEKRIIFSFSFISLLISNTRSRYDFVTIYHRYRLI